MSSTTIKIFLIAVHVSLAGLLYGLDTGSIGPIIVLPQFEHSIGHLSSTIQGLYVASILLSASFSSLCSGYVADRISRKFGILMGAILTIVGTVVSASSRNFAALMCGRLITGLGSGQAISVVTVYLCEIAPQDIRGALACMLQFLITIGIALGYFIVYGTRNLTGDLAWRVPFIIQACTAVILAVGMMFVPFSPRWLIQVGRRDDARRTLEQLRDGVSIEDELEGIEIELNESKYQNQATFMEMFEKRYLKRTLLGIFIMSFQQLTGIDAVLYYAPILFTQAGFTSQKASFLASGVSGIINILFTLPAQIWVDKWGRRPPLIIGGIAMAACFFVIGSLYAINGGRENGEVYLSGKGSQWTVLILIYVFVANFAWSWAVVGKIYSCEIIPTRLRAKACAVQLLCNWLVNFTVALTTPTFLRASPSGPYFFFGSTTLFAAAVCWLVMPETMGKSLEDIEHLFKALPG